MPKKILLTAKEISEMLSISRSLVYAYAEKGILRPITLPSARPSKAILKNKKSIRFSIDEVNKFVHNLSGWSPKKEGDNAY